MNEYDQLLCQGGVGAGGTNHHEGGKHGLA